MLSHWLDFYAPLASTRIEASGALSLLSPTVNILGVNATSVPDSAPPDELELNRVRALHRAHGLPPVLVSSAPMAGAEVVAALQVGTFCPIPRSAPEPERPEVVVEQVSRLHLAQWSRVLAGAYATPQWAAAIARHLAGRLEQHPDYVLLLAYRRDQAVGALLWRAESALLWGTLEPEAAPALLQAAHDLSGHLRCATVAGQPISLQEAQPLLILRI